MTRPRASKDRVAVALSGGLDSAVALALLQQQGHDVFGVTMRLSRDDAQAADIDAAQAICARRRVEHVVVDLSDAFTTDVIGPFVAEYAAGRTPNPCVRCNERIKFGVLLERARELGADALATGHYARITQEHGCYRLWRGEDGAKDQSYFLYTLTQEVLASVVLPLGAYRKEHVRLLARDLGYAVAERAESQDVCFLRGAPYVDFVRERAPAAFRPGPIVDRAGRLLGTHQGLPQYTVGQRGGLGVSAPEPLYVLALDVVHNTIVAGYGRELGSRVLLVEQMHYVSGQAPGDLYPLQVQIRYRATPAIARLQQLTGGRALVVFDASVRDAAPGQSLVLYRGDEVLGGGIIAQVDPADAP